MSQSDFLQIDQEKKLYITIQDLIGQSINIIGLKRSGKSHTGGVLLEEWLEHSLPATIVDPQNEWWGLKQRYPVVLAGRSSRADCPLSVEHAAELALFSFQNRVPVILSLLGFNETDRFALLSAYFQKLWTLAEEAFDAGEPKPYAVLLEEARVYIPQTASTPVKPILRDIILGGGKYGLTTFLLNQRSASIDKEVFTQGSIYFLHKVVHRADKDLYKDVLPIPEAQTEALVAQLGRGDAIVLYSAPESSVIGGTIEVVHIRDRFTFHAGSTPTLQTTPPPLQALDATLLQQLQNLMTSSIKKQPDAMGDLQKQLQNAQGLLLQKDEEIIRLKAQLEQFSVLRVEMPEMIDQLTVNRADIRVSGMQRSLLPPVIDQGGKRDPLSSVTVVEEQRSLLPSQKDTLEEIQKKLRKLSAFEFRVLRVLLDHDAREFGWGELSSEMGLSYDAFKSAVQRADYLKTLISLPFVLEKTKNRSHHYKAIFRSFFEKYDVQVVRQELNSLFK